MPVGTQFEMSPKGLYGSHLRGLISENCIFCKVAERKIPSKIVYEDELVIGFEDISPRAPVHLLVIPKKHIPTMLEVTDTDKDIVFKMLMVANKLAAENKIANNGFRIIINCNSLAGQTVYHLHMHIMGGRLLGWPPG